ncbi:hypothetical protein BV22DRAFT_836378 [Leucogyrophana mollusca]|uniref:Uncharacterized protein n=1 Tax=Leucogyrophana mollusca TaxID=85980 RepID=A0ACB8B2F1_9AGAM|nr:hypothetical protein BV22DRAFT_836378 [Leucogyrophana mollusca]
MASTSRYRPLPNNAPSCLPSCHTSFPSIFRPPRDLNAIYAWAPHSRSFSLYLYPPWTQGAQGPAATRPRPAPTHGNSPRPPSNPCSLTRTLYIWIHHGGREAPSCDSCERWGYRVRGVSMFVRVMFHVHSPSSTPRHHQYFRPPATRTRPGVHLPHPHICVKIGICVFRVRVRELELARV